MTKRIRYQAGDTLVEVLIAITILSVVLSTSYALATRAFRTLQVARDQAQATFLAQEQIEAAKSLKDSLPFASFLTFVGQTTDLDAPDCDNVVLLNGAPFNLAAVAVGPNHHWCVRNANNLPSLPSQPLYTITNTITTDPAAPQIPNQATLVVTVSWTEIGSGANRSLSYTARFRDTGP